MLYNLLTIPHLILSNLLNILYFSPIAMKLLTFSLLLSPLFSSCLAAPANAQLDQRQEPGHFTYTVTCNGPRCNDGPPVLPTQPPKPTTSKPNPPKTTSTPKPTSKYTPPPENPPTKTIKSTAKPTKTQGGEVGPSSTKCPVPLYYQCGGYYDGEPWTGCTKCVSGAKCIWQNDFYYQCVADE